MDQKFDISTRIIIILMLEHLSYGRLMIKPMNQAGYVRDSTDIMNCSSDTGSNAITWYFTLFDTADNVTVAVGASITPEYVSFFQIDQPNSQASNLIIPRASELTAGTYTCSDGTEAASAQHSLLNVSQMVVYLNIFSTTKNGDVFYYTCTAKYYGNDFMIPRFYFMPNTPGLTQNITTMEITKTDSFKLAKGTAIGTAVCGLFTGLYYIYFSEPRGNLPSGSATNAPTLLYTVGIDGSINISCVPTDDNMTITGPTANNLLSYGEIIICNVTSSTPVNYIWTDFTFGNKSKGQQLRVWHNGSYQCSASTEQDGKIYSASKALYNLTVIILKAFPLFGPISGGTWITFSIESWSDKIANNSGVYFGKNLKAAIDKNDLRKRSLVVVSPAASDDLVQQPLQITMEITPGPFNFTNGFYFTYLSNPEITGLSPNSFIVTGGTSIDVSGSSLSSVSNPLIQVSLSVTRVNATENIMKTTNDSCEVINSDGTEMSCNMPTVDIPKDFLDILDSIYLTNTTSNKVITDSNVLQLIGPNGIDQAIVYLGFILDGYQKYKNINSVLPDTKITFYSSPEINSSQKVYEYNPSEEGLFIIQGNHLTRGCRLADYGVRVGDGVCENVDLTDNALTCRLPDKQPQLTQNDSILCSSGLFMVMINIGYKQYQYVCLKYVFSSSKVTLIVGLCVGLGGFLILIIASIGLFFCCRKRHSNKTDQNQYSLPQQYPSIYDHVYELSSENFEKTDHEYEEPTD